MPRYVILEHDHPVWHLDLMLEVGEVLWTWRLTRLPDETPQVAVRTFDHRLLYLEYEGPVSGNRGSVRRVASGIFEWVQQEVGRLTIRLEGSRGTSILELALSDQDQWELTGRGPAIT